MLQLCKSSLLQHKNANEALLKGNELVGPSSGFDDQLDKINTEFDCQINSNNNTDIHDNYRCSSASQGLTIFTSMIESVIDEIQIGRGNFDNKLIAHSLHLLNKHLLGKFELAVERIQDINAEFCDNLKSKILTTTICGIFVVVITFVISMIFYIKSVIIYNAGMFLLQRLPPQIFFSDKKLQNFLMSKKELKEEAEMSTSQSVIFMHKCIRCC
ncbi:hypothetical protein M9Y10_007571 [Tritrichomonas musculus]|uniref:Uncharacterized protein n=1 Tax=Tritrichomonas musculus TaxID=1915356 RepID=A0ABR2J1Q0_9EUKA